MPTELQVQSVILSAQRKLANYMNNNLSVINSGNLFQNSALINYLNLNILGLQFQENRLDFTSNTTITIYNRLLELIGIDTGNNNVDPNFQPQAGQIIKVNINLPPIVISWSDFSTIGSPDAGVTRINYFNPDWIGVNPFMALTSPGLTGLELNTDYTLIPTGGFTLLLTGNLPGIFDGELITVYNYAFA